MFRPTSALSNLGETKSEKSGQPGKHVNSTVRRSSSRSISRSVSRSKSRSKSVAASRSLSRSSTRSRLKSRSRSSSMSRSPSYVSRSSSPSPVRPAVKEKVSSIFPLFLSICSCIFIISIHRILLLLILIFSESEPFNNSLRR